MSLTIFGRIFESLPLPVIADFDCAAAEFGLGASQRLRRRVSRLSMEGGWPAERFEWEGYMHLQPFRRPNLGYLNDLPRSPHLPIRMAHAGAYCLGNPRWANAVAAELVRRGKKDIADFADAIVVYYEGVVYSYRSSNAVPNTALEALIYVDQFVLGYGVATIQEIERFEQLTFSLLPGAPYPPGFHPEPADLLWIDRSFKGDVHHGVGQEVIADDDEPGDGELRVPKDWMK